MGQRGEKKLLWQQIEQILTGGWREVGKAALGALVEEHF
jgi:hypothetical protein